MSNRRHTLLWMKDLIDHMSRCHDQLEWTKDGETQLFLAEAMLGDLVECQRLCEQLRSAQLVQRIGSFRRRSSAGLRGEADEPHAMAISRHASSRRDFDPAFSSYSHSIVPGGLLVTS